VDAYLDAANGLLGFGSNGKKRVVPVLVSSLPAGPFWPLRS